LLDINKHHNKISFNCTESGSASVKTVIYCAAAYRYAMLTTHTEYNAAHISSVDTAWWQMKGRQNSTTNIRNSLTTMYIWEFSKPHTKEHACYLMIIHPNLAG